MARIIKYIPEQKEAGEKFPVVIGLPGFVGMLDGGRIERILKELNNYRIAGCGVLYDGIDEEREGERDRKVVCRFNLEDVTKNIEEAFKRIAEDERFDVNRSGALTTSISSCALNHAFVYNRLNGTNLKALAQISPWVSYKTYRTEAERKWLEMKLSQGMSEIPITSRFDSERGITRVIPAECAPELKKLDSIAELRENGYKKRFDIMTLLGNKDKTCSPDAMMEYHRALCGDDKNLIVFDGEDHNIPFERIVEPAISFFVENLILRN